MDCNATFDIESRPLNAPNVNKIKCVKSKMTIKKLSNPFRAEKDLIPGNVCFIEHGLL
jgi:hypothetical protein